MSQKIVRCENILIILAKFASYGLSPKEILILTECLSRNILKIFFYHRNGVAVRTEVARRGTDIAK